MYFEEFDSPGALSPATAEALVDVAGRYSSTIVITANDHSVHAPLLPLCWADLGIAAGTTVTVTADKGHRPPDVEDRSALRAFVGRFREVTGSDIR
ncbi:HPr family phosphocarrier protein [Nocardia cyriacigeorgica]|uniref:HPr family phosphocarrier protein n=1 Tax=Nocardia cyriacigeorgica TaxID=135487 RepID=UPI002455C948|nr:HPr family phosphocarrier protein [Nocardia cyriacigeorgica]